MTHILTGLSSPNGLDTSTAREYIPGLDHRGSRAGCKLQNSFILVVDVARPPAMDQDDIHWINRGGVALSGASGTRLAKFELK